MAEYIQVGFTAARDPATREFLPAVPLYIEKTPDAAQSEKKLIDDLGKLFALRMRAYIDDGGLIENAKVKKEGI